MRVLSVIIAHPLRKVSGATNAGLQLSEAVARLIDIEAAIMWDTDDTVIAGDLVIRRVRSTTRLGMIDRFVPRFMKVPLYDSRIPEMLSQGEYDLVHIHNLVPTLAAARLGRVCQKLGIPYVISTHGFFELSSYAQLNGFGRVKSALVDVAITRPFRRVVAGAARILALSDCEHELLSQMGVRPDQIDVVTNGVNEFFLSPSSEQEMRHVREKFNIGQDPVLLFMGSLHAYKGVGVFLQSLSKISGPFQAVVAGRFKHPKEAEDLLAGGGVSESLRKRIVFTGGVTNEELRALYHAADLFVYPTMGDTLPLVVLEAMACGLPVVSTTVGGIPFEVPAECGILVPPNNPEATAEAVTAMLSSPARRRAAGVRARERVLSTFRWESSAKCAVAAYEKSVAGRRRTFTAADRIQVS